MTENRSNIPASLDRTIQSFDTAFSEDRGSDVSQCFSENGRLQWPFREDIVGRDDIRAVFEGFVSRFTTISWKPSRSIELICDGKVVIIGRFTEHRQHRDTGEEQRVFGRMVEVWAEAEKGKWSLELLMTSRYAESEQINKDTASA